MAISTDQNRVTYSGDGSSATFNYQYEFHADTEISVFVYNSSRATVIQSQDLTTDYTISGDKDKQNRYLNGANIVFNSSPATGDEIVIFGSAAVNSDFALAFSEAIPSQELVKALDRLTILTQRLNDQTTRSVRLDDAYPFSFDTKLPAQLTKGAPLIVNSAATGVELGVVAAGSAFLGILNTVNGGTGANLTPAIGDLLYADSTTTFGLRTAGASGLTLRGRGAAQPVWESINVGSTDQITGTLAFGNGGTGRTTIGADGEVMMAGTGAIVFEKINLASSATITGTLPFGNGGTGLSTIGADGLVLMSGTGALVYEKINLGSSATVTGTLPTGNGGTGLTGYSANELLYSSDASTLANLGGGSSGNVLTSNGSSAPSWNAVTVSPLATVATTADYQATTAEDTILAGSGTGTITLFDASGNDGRSIKIHKTFVSSEPVTIVGSGAQTVNASSFLLHNVYDAAEFTSDDSNFLGEISAIRTPTVQKFTSGGGTYTTPDNVAFIKVKEVGGGGGGAGSGTSTPGVGQTGSSTIFGSSTSSVLICNGGAGGSWGNGNGGQGGATTLGAAAIGYGVEGGGGDGVNGSGTPTFENGGGGGATIFGGGGGYSTAAANTGGGGRGGANTTAGSPGSGGGGGGGIDAIIIPTAGQTFNYVVGNGGPGGTAGPSAGAAGIAGAAGQIIVWEFYK